MWYGIIITFVFAVMAVSIALYINTGNPWYVLPLTMSLIGFIVMITVFFTNTVPASINSAEGELRMYNKAVAEKDMLESDIQIPLEVMADYSDDIVEMNRLIMKSRKFCDNWFLNPIYHKETAALQLIDENINTHTQKDTIR